MTLYKFQERFDYIKPLNSGHWKVTIKYYGLDRSFTTTNGQAVDRIKGQQNYKDRDRHSSHTLKEAYEVLFKEMKRTLK